MTVAEDLALTAELCGGGQISEAAAHLFVSELASYPPAAVHEALARCRREVIGRLTLAHVVERIDDGRPGPEEAWVMIPKNEADSAALTAEAREAMFIALPLITIGDLVQARMAFLESYRRLVSQARAARENVTWQLTLGHDKLGRESAQKDLEARLGYDGRPQIEGPDDTAVDVAPIREFVKLLAERKSIERITEQNAALEAAAQAHAQGKKCATGCERCWDA